MTETDTSTIKEEKKLGMLAFMPWTLIEERTKLGNWELIPVEIKDLAESDKEVKRILKCFKIHVGCSIHGATLIKNNKKNLLDSLDENERVECFLLGEIVSFSSLAMREFFSWGHYTNSESQSLILQSFVEDSKGFSIVSRRRDGNSTNYTSDEYHVVIQDSHVKNGKLVFDEDLAKALLESQNRPEWSNIHEGIFCYLRANTDDSNVQVQSELMFAMGAFERLLNVNNGQCAESARRFVEQLSSVLSEEPKSNTDERSYGKLNQSESVREIWMRDFCACRGDMAHGRTQQSYQSIWNPGEHLLLSAEIFPILMKIKLSKMSLYTLSDDDLQRIFYFDRRLRVASLYKISEDRGEPKFGWEEVRRKAVWEWTYLKKSLIPSTRS